MQKIQSFYWLHFKFKFSNSKQTFVFNLPVFAAKCIWKIWPSPSTWQKNYDLRPAKGEKNCDPPHYPFSYFQLIFFNINNIFYKKMCSLQQLCCMFSKSWKAVFFSLSSKGGWPFTAILSVCVWRYFLASFFKWRPLMINRVITKDGVRGEKICFMKITSFRMLIKS